MGGLSVWHWIVVIVVVLLLFGRGKISELMGDMAQGIKAFKKGMADEPEAAKSEPPKAEPVKTIDAKAEHLPGDLAQRAQTEKRVEGTTS